MAKGKRDNADLATTAERRRFVIEARRSGLTYEKVAEAAVKRFGINRLPLGWNSLYAYKDVKRELDRLRKEVSESASDLLDMELARLDILLAGLWPQATRGNVGAIDRVIKLMDRRAKYLGLDAPTKVQHGGGVQVDVAVSASRFDDWLQRQITAKEAQEGEQGDG